MNDRKSYKLKKLYVHLIGKQTEAPGSLSNSFNGTLVVV